MRSMIEAGVVQAKREAQFLGWLFGVVIVFGLLVVQPAQRFYDKYLRPVPWISADLELLPAVEPEEGILIKYGVNTEVQLNGTWSAWLQVDQRQRCFARGSGSYSSKTPHTRLWPLTEWLAMTCRVPDVPFAACVKYEVTTETGAAGSFGPYCSPLFDPRNKGTRE